MQSSECQIIKGFTWRIYPKCVNYPYYTVQVLDEPGTLLINGEECRILLDEEVILIDNLTRKQQFAAWPFILADQPSASIFPPGF